MSAVGIVAAALELTELGLAFATLAQQYGALIGRAQAEGRDITADELAELRATREAAVARWFAPSPRPGGG